MHQTEESFCGHLHMVVVSEESFDKIDDYPSYEEESMKRVCGLMLFCFGLGMTLLLFIPETLKTLIFIIGCLTLGYYLFAC